MYEDIRTALVAHYQVLGLTLPVIQENSDTNEEEYIQITFVPAANDIASLGQQGMDRLRGFIQFSVTIKAGTKSVPAFKLASQIVKHFQRGTSLTYNGVTVKITQPVSNGGFTSENKYTVPVTINWSADIQRL